jgi:hypothetical protein
MRPAEPFACGDLKPAKLSLTRLGANRTGILKTLNPRTKSREAGGL